MPNAASAKLINPSSAAVPKILEGNPMSLEPDKALKNGSRKRCKARTKAGDPCQAPAVEGGLCFCHAHPEKLAELGRQGGQKNRRWSGDASNLPHRPLKSAGEVSELLEETINRVRRGPFDLRSANSIGFLAGTLLRALDQQLDDGPLGSIPRVSVPRTAMGTASRMGTVGSTYFGSSSRTWNI